MRYSPASAKRRISAFTNSTVGESRLSFCSSFPAPASLEKVPGRREEKGGRIGWEKWLLRCLAPVVCSGFPRRGKGGARRGGLKIKLHVAAGGLWGKRRGGGGKSGQTFRSPGKERGDMKLSCIFHVCRGSHRRRRGDPSFWRDEIFFFAPVHSRLLPWRVRFFFFARLSRLLYSERYLPPPLPLFGFMSVPEDGEKSSMPSPFFPFVSLKLELDACLPGGEEAGGA